MANVPTPLEMRRKLPSVEPSKTVAKIAARAAEGTDGVASLRGAKSGSNAGTNARRRPADSAEEKMEPSLSMTGSIKIPDIPEMSSWVSPTGMYRMGPDGIPLRFKLPKGKSAAGALDITSHGGALPGVAYGHQGIELALSSASFQSGTMREDGKHGAEDYDKVLSHDLALLVALIGADAVVAMGLR